MMQHCLWGRGQRENNAALLLVSSPNFHEPSCETGNLSHHGNPCRSPQLALSPSFPLSQPCLQSLLPHLGFSQPAPPTQSLPCHWFSVCHLTGLFGLVDCFFNSLVFRVPCSLIFWHFWLFIDFTLVVILLLVVGGSEGFLSIPPSWPELLKGLFL